MADFEGHEGLTSPQPSKNQFAARRGVGATPAPGNGSLPPGANTFRVNKRKGASTPASFIKKVGG